MRTVLIMVIELMNALNHLRAADVTVSILPDGKSGIADSVVDIAVGTSFVRFAIKRRQRAPFRNEIPDIDDDRRSLETYGRPLLIAPYIPESLGSALSEAGWSWADDQGNYDVRDVGLRLRQRRTFTEPRRTRRFMPSGSGSWSVIRTLIALQEEHEDGLSPTELAKRAHVSQPRASQVLRELATLELVQRSSNKRWKPHRSALLDQFLNEYPGPRGTEQLLYSLDSPAAVTIKLTKLASPRSFVTSADIAPDLIAAWRRPTVVIFYAASDLPIDDLGLVEAHGRADANVIFREPRDHSVFPATYLSARVEDIEIPLADPSQIIWDLQDLGGDDRLEAAGRMRSWLLESRSPN
jgi:hypothetical protein